MRFIKIFIVVAIVALLCLSFFLFTGKQISFGGDDLSKDKVRPTMSVADMTPYEIKDGVTYYADIDIKNYGKITVKLDQSAAPITVANFATLASNGFYDGLTFHRIMEGFMMQGGDPEGTGLGGSDRKIKGEFADNGVDNPLKHERGTISMARSNAYDSASSQFFIVHEDSFGLDGEYAAFGNVTEGIEVVDKICEAAKPIDGNGKIARDKQPVINTITVREG